ncbi:hypothetical protein [Paractinoplanes deccanensis]|uniref:hypothetical protein n=1 Tax=Paractinoplanes deccanensis TaxID=113561 RepID=UPI001944D5AD|nr:hypothetical protein [Actinoplanes deccanensis]
MNALLPFGARLARLLEHRAMSATALAQAAGIPAGRLDAVLASGQHDKAGAQPDKADGQPQLDEGGGQPDDDLLRRLGPALGLHTSDLFLFAGRTVPDDLAPAQVRRRVNGVVTTHAKLVHTKPAAAARLRRFVDELPVRPVRRTEPFPSDRLGTSPGGILWRLLANRNMRVKAGALMFVGGGPYLSDSTYVMACWGRIPLKESYLNAFARTVGIPVGDLAALLGLRAAETPWSADFSMLPWNVSWPSASVELAWAARRLDDDQIREAVRYAVALDSDTSA